MATALTSNMTPSPIEQDSSRHAQIAHYIKVLGWPLVVSGDGMFLPAHLGIVGLTLPAGLAGEVNTEIKRREIGIPIIAIPGTPSRWVFLVEPPVGPVPTLPVHVGLMIGPARIPLPPSVVDGEPVRWICEPGAGFVHVPEFRPVLLAVRHNTNPRAL